MEKNSLLKKIHKISRKNLKKFQKLNFFSKFHNFLFTLYFFMRLMCDLENFPKYYFPKKKFFFRQKFLQFFWYKKSTFFFDENLKKIFKKNVFFQSCRTFYLLDIFSWDRSMKQSTFQSLIFCKKNYQISTLKKNFFYIFSKGFTAAEKIWIFCHFLSKFLKKKLMKHIFFHK